MGFWTSIPEEPAEVSFESELRLSTLEPELADLFTEVGESILTLTGLCRGIFIGNC